MKRTCRSIRSSTGFRRTPGSALQRYPQPDDPNPEVRVGVVSAAGRQDDLGACPHPRRPGLHSALRLGRSQNTMGGDPHPRSQASRHLLCRCRQRPVAPGPRTDRRQVSRRELRCRGRWRHPLSSPTGRTATTISTSTATTPGTRVRATAKLEKQLTKGEFEVDGISSIDWAKKLVYFASNQGNVLEQQLWQVELRRRAEAAHHDARLSRRQLRRSRAVRMSTPSPRA